MELHQIKTFVMVAKTGHLTKAAEKLFTTPPSVSSHINQLEETLGVRLFERTAKGMRLTEAGRVLEKQAQAVLDSVRALSEAAANLTGALAGPLSLGINADPRYLKVIEAAQRLRDAHPNIRLEIFSSNTEAILKQLEQEELDVGFVFGVHDTPKLRFVDLGRVDLEIVLPARYRKTHARASLVEVAELPWIVPSSSCPFLDKIRALMARHGLKIENEVFANDDITKAAYLAQGAAATVLLRDEARDHEEKGAVFIWQSPLPLRCEVSLAYAERQKEAPLIRALVAIVKAIYHAP